MSKLNSKKREMLKSFLKDIVIKKEDDDKCCGPMSSSAYLPSLHIDTKMVPDFKGKNVGDEVLMAVGGVIASHEMYEREGGEGRDNYSVKITKIGVTDNK